MKNQLLIIFLFSGLISQSQINAGPDQTICFGESTMLYGSGPSTHNYIWNSIPFDPTISDPTILTPTVQPALTTVYTLEGRSVSILNLITNGNFESGNTGFTSSYIYSPGPNGLWAEGTYAITNDVNYNHNSYFCDNDHTTGIGNFMAINGASTPNVEVWSTTIINISQNTEYEFSAWIASLGTTNPAILQFEINGVLIGQPFTASSVTCQWNMFSETWNSGDATSAVISILNQNTAASGNDFSLDDLNFSEVIYFYDECTITVASNPTSTLTADDTIIAYGTNTILHAVINGNPGPVVFEWHPEDKLQNPNSLDPETILMEQSTLFTFIATDETTLCSSADTLSIKVTDGVGIVLGETINTESTIMFPNPVLDILNIDSKSKIISIKVINAAGQLVYKENIGSMNTKFHFDNLPKGLYFVNIETINSICTKKIIVN